MHIIRLTHIMYYYVCILHVYIVTSPFFWHQRPPLHVYNLQHDMLWIDHLWIHVVCLWLFDRCSILIGKMDFQDGSCHLWCPHHSLLYESSIVIGPGLKLCHASRQSCHSLLDACYLAASNQYYSSRGTECLEVCMTLWRSGRLYAKWFLLLVHCCKF